MAWRVFYSYSHKDSELRERLATYLAPLRQQKKISEWHDRKIEPGADWNTEINTQLDTADLIVLLVSADFLASDYCFGVEIEKAMTRLKRGEVKVVPVLLKPCLWEESRFSDLQILPRDAKAITSWTSVDEALKDVASEFRTLVAEPPPAPAQEPAEPRRFDTSLDLVRGQVHAYAGSYERTRQRMRPSFERTQRMDAIFHRMCGIATASYPLLDELASSPSPGERLAAVAILQSFSAASSIPFLARLIASEKPFVGYHAAKALRFAVSALDATAYPLLLDAIQEAQKELGSQGYDSDRKTVLDDAERELRATMSALAAPTEQYE